MKALLLAVGLGLVAALRTSDTGDLDVSGQWYLKAIVADKDCKRKTEALTPINITALEGGDLEVRVGMLVDGQCQEVKVDLEMMDEPGKYSAFGGRRKVDLQKMRAADHYAFFCEGELGDEQVRMGKLVGKDPEINPEALEEFRKVAEGRGFNPKRIVFPKQIETCTPGKN
ncbi:lipocalin-1 [Dasypus novemcinctus]|uniref:lipocalin-1 n=1 Tax=Dasypus novemcinctus TaxID=9361 RepID=UPI000328A461|nr:lipocalin-1 [Dasypus novemcinctus]